MSLNRVQGTKGHVPNPRPLQGSKPGPNQQQASSTRLHSNRANGLNGSTSQAHPNAQAQAQVQAQAPGPGASSSVSRQQESWIKARQIYQQQLLTEHFGFSPLSFVDDVINSVNNMIYQASMALQEFIENEMQKVVAGTYGHLELPSDVDPMTESAKGMHKFETLLEAAVDKNFDRFELYALKNLFGVPEDVDIVLPHYEALDFEISVEKEEKLDEELELLRRQLIATKALNYRLRKELELAENRRRELEKCREQIQFLKDAVKEVEPVPQTMIFVRDNIETLHRRFQSLHETLLKSTQLGGSSSFHFAQQQQQQQQQQQHSAPAESVSVALRETLVGMAPDLRAAYIRSVVRREIEDQLASVASSPPASAPAVTVTLRASATAAETVPSTTLDVSTATAAPPTPRKD
ncbi:hypothetical protein BGX28_003645 [Mortierella sp. GBA30]|nr:hypothetical protein BGX28_003645 [Mortierella sp. GBA30]